MSSQIFFFFLFLRKKTIWCPLMLKTTTLQTVKQKVEKGKAKRGRQQSNCVCSQYLWRSHIIFCLLQLFAPQLNQFMDGSSKKRKVRAIISLLLNSLDINTYNSSSAKKKIDCTTCRRFLPRPILCCFSFCEGIIFTQKSMLLLIHLNRTNNF